MEEKARRTVAFQAAGIDSNDPVQTQIKVWESDDGTEAKWIDPEQVPAIFQNLAIATETLYEAQETLKTLLRITMPSPGGALAIKELKKRVDDTLMEIMPDDEGM